MVFPKKQPLTGIRIDSNLNAIKGGGACHLQEKVVAEATSTWVMIAESHKRSNVLGTKVIKIPLDWSYEVQLH